MPGGLVPAAGPCLASRMELCNGKRIAAALQVATLLPLAMRGDLDKEI